MTADAVGGVWSYAVELREALVRAGWEVVIATVGLRPPPEPGIRWHRSRLEWEPDSEADVESAAHWLRDVADEVAADVVHINGFGPATQDWRRPTVVVAHSCVSSWYEAVRGAAPPSAWDHYHEQVTAGLRRADAVVAPTEAMLCTIQRLYGLGRRGRVIHNAVAPGPPPARQRAAVVLAAGRLWDEAKGLDVLDRAAARLPWPVEVAGEVGGARPRHVRRLGPLPRARLRQRMAGVAVFAHPARYEPFGLVVLEAALGGCALVLGDIPSLRELWDGAAAFVAPGDPDALARTLADLAAAPARRSALASRALARAQGYRPHVMARSYAALYESLQARWRAAA